MNESIDGRARHLFKSYSTLFELVISRFINYRCCPPHTSDLRDFFRVL